ncbi:MAG: imidazole glycerol phosphate synthase subunit HisH [Gammaproteobacteria bacterium]
MSRIAVLDYGASNLRSVSKALEHVSGGKHRIIVSDEARTIRTCSRVVFPGQGAIGQCMERLGKKGLMETLRESVADKPFLGICLGLQTLMQESEENGGTLGLGIIPGKVIKFPDDARDKYGNPCKIPHMGWNNLMRTQEHPLWKGIDTSERFYFVHSYYVLPEREQDIAAMTDYVTEFTSVIARDNLFAVQFHPEKSQRAGLQLLRNFLDWS